MSDSETAAAAATALRINSIDRPTEKKNLIVANVRSTMLQFADDGNIILLNTVLLIRGRSL